LAGHDRWRRPNSDDHSRDWPSVVNVAASVGPLAVPVHSREARAACRLHRRGFLVHRCRPPHTVGSRVTERGVHGGASVGLCFRRL
jgi:hypothetical protein